MGSTVRRIPADILGSREWGESSEALQVAFQELRPNLRERVGVITGKESAADVLQRMAAAVHYYLRVDRAAAILTEGVTRGLFAVKERPRDDGQEGVESVVVIRSLPPSVYRARYEDRRGPRGGLTDAERQQRRRLRQQAPTTPSTPDPTTPSTPDPVTDNVTETSRSVSPTLAAPPPPDTPFRGGVLGGEGGERVNRKPADGQVNGSVETDTSSAAISADGQVNGSVETDNTSSAKRTDRQRGQWAVTLLASETATAFCGDASGPELIALGRVVASLGYSADDLTAIAAHWRVAPTSWRNWCPRDARRAPRCTVGMLLGKKTANQHTGDGLRAAREAARSAPTAASSAPTAATPQEGARSWINATLHVYQNGEWKPLPRPARSVPPSPLAQKPAKS